jgi:hypothetical protein
MALEPTETRVFEILKIGELIRSPQGHTSLECETDAGTVAFWAGKSTLNLRSLQRRTPPFKVRCGCRPPLPNFPTHAWWVPDGTPIEFLDARDTRGSRETRVTRDDPEGPDDDEVPATPARRPVPVAVPAASPFRALAREERTLYVVGATKSTVWDDEPKAELGVFVPAVFAYRGKSVREWLASTQREQASHWLFLNARYGLIEPEHPIGNSEATFSDPASGPIPDDALRVQVEYQRRWNDQVALREFQTVYVWCESTAYEEKARTAFELVGAKVVRLKSLTRAK